MSLLAHYALLCAPMFLLIGLGHGLMTVFKWPPVVNNTLSRFVFTVALPALLFRLMSDLSRLPPVDLRVLVAYFGSCLLVFVGARIVASRVFKLDGVGQSMFALAGIFSNNVLLGIPLAKATLGETAMPTVALVLVFNALTLWTLVTVSIEWARHGSPSVKGLGAALRGVVCNPIIIAIAGGSLVGLSGLRLPPPVLTPLTWMGELAAPLALITLGMGLAEHGIREHWRLSSAMTGIKLVAQPLLVWGLARLLGLGHIETRGVVLLASLSAGANVYLMSRQFRAIEGPVAATLVVSTAVAAVTTPVLLALTA